MLFSACAEEPPAAATVPPSATASEAVDAAPAPEPSATASAEIVPPSVSGAAPPPAPAPGAAASTPVASASAAAGAMSEARKAALAKELTRLEVQMLDVLEKEPHPKVLDSPRLDDVSLAGPGNEVRVGRADSGGARLDTPPPERPLTISGKALRDATIADVEAALREAGCTDITKKPGDGPLVVLTATKGADTFIITFLPASADIALDRDERARLLKDAAVVEKDGLFLAVEAKGWKSAARALLDAVARRS